MVTAQAFQQTCFSIAAVSGAVCLYSLIMWPVREKLARLSVKRTVKR